MPKESYSEKIKKYNCLVDFVVGTDDCGDVDIMYEESDALIDNI